MAGSDLVDGAGWISDDSDFYGILTPSYQGKLEAKFDIHVKRRREDDSPETTAKRVKREPGATLRTESSSTHNVKDFLRSRPQVSGLKTTDATTPHSLNAKTTSNALSEEATDLLDDLRFKGKPSAWQPDESITDFLRRLPVADPDTARIGPWLWVCNPKIDLARKKHESKTDVNAFTEGGTALLEAYKSTKSRVEKDNAGKAAGIITRYMRPHREQLEDDLRTLAIKTGTTCGKWMFFPAPDDLPRTWRLIAEATASGKLGPVSKAATFDPMATKSERVICVYTYDFSDIADVRRVLEQLIDLGLVVASSPRGIYYKCDAYTYLDIKSDNAYKLKASMYSSKELLNGDARNKRAAPAVLAKNTPAAASDSPWEF